MDREGDLKLPCGSCNECISSRAVDWAIRARHEISCHKDNCFLTLTYDDASLPSHLVLKHPFQRFMHNLRRREKKKFSYIVSHEYGSQFFRPHHHAIIFGYNPNDQKFLKSSKSGERLFTSPEISRLWPNGFHSIGSATERSAYYIAAYALKGKKHSICLPNGEVVDVSDSFDCSKRPGIGLNYFRSNYRSLVASGDPLPRYYLKKLSVLDPELFQSVEDERRLCANDRSAQQRLAKFTIQDARLAISNNEFRVSNQSDPSKKFLKSMLKKSIYKPNIPKEEL